MPENKAKIAVSISADLARRIDAIADARDENRSRVVERIIQEGIDEQEKFLRTMENPVTRTILEALGTKPSIVRAIAELVGDSLDEEQVTEMVAGMKKQTKLGRGRSASKRPRKKVAPA